MTKLLETRNAAEITAKMRITSSSSMEHVTKRQPPQIRDLALRGSPAASKIIPGLLSVSLFSFLLFVYSLPSALKTLKGVFVDDV